MKYWHISSFESTTILCQDNSPDHAAMMSHDGNAYGPFDTFTECKQDALEYHRTTKRVTERSIAEIKAMRRQDIGKE